MKFLFGIAIGVVATYLYFTPGTVEDVVESTKSTVNETAQIVVDATK
jgi:hypothetical protein